MPTVVHVTSAEDVFGPEKTVINECLALQAQGWQAKVANIWPSDETPFARKVRAAGIECHHIPARRQIDRGALRALSELLDSSDRPVVHSHGYKADAYSALAAWRTKTPSMTTVHGWTSENFKVRVYERVQSLLWRFFDRVVCVSDSYARTALAAGVPSQRTSVVRNAIHAEYATDPKSREVRVELGLPAVAVVVAIIGRLSIEKGHAFLLDAIAALPGRSNIQLLVIGDGPERSNLERHSAALGLSGQTTFLGHRNDTPRLYGAVDILAIASAREGLPNVLLEAMLYGIPCVATAVGGIPEVISDGRNGLLVEPGALPAYKDALLRLATDLPLRRQLGANARETIMKEYLFSSRMERMMALYEDLDTTRQPRAGRDRA